ncbi:MAG: hypothetical protein NT018_13760 [Armatimonadetes bacterium]|nr:hypothetical protein [Armatimonadota bacterium]
MAYDNFPTFSRGAERVGWAAGTGDYSLLAPDYVAVNWNVPNWTKIFIEGKFDSGFSGQLVGDWRNGRWYAGGGAYVGTPGVSVTAGWYEYDWASHSNRAEQLDSFLTEFSTNATVSAGGFLTLGRTEGRPVNPGCGTGYATEWGWSTPNVSYSTVFDWRMPNPSR